VLLLTFFEGCKQAILIANLSKIFKVIESFLLNFFLLLFGVTVSLVLVEISKEDIFNFIIIILLLLKSDLLLNELFQELLFLRDRLYVFLNESSTGNLSHAFLSDRLSESRDLEGHTQDTLPTICGRTL
jgi:hypothetical protein